MKILKTICWTISAILAFLGLSPLIYRIFHIGNVFLVVLAFLAFILPFLIKWSKTNEKTKLFIIVGYFIIFGLVSGISAFMLHQAYGLVPPNTGKQTLIVLGSKVNGKQPSNLLRNRLLVALHYLEENPEAVVITSGGQGADESYPEGLVMANFLIDRGIDESRVFIEDKSTSTKENLTFSKKLIPSDSNGVIIVSDNFHLARAVILAKSLGIQSPSTLASLAPYGLVPAYWFRDLGGVPLTWLEENVFNKN